ncbi:shikimate dehydrogenase [Microbacterium capsulatum]|uniref:Shikimate dehydrogenase n=1 Tax=Microbacterium capsulatum TaxID=3041921 RepID=A0ABU0XGE0_9MICO|nr:shikimate dehydrogenase [Microbacterium sp. ASV81]MDQ4212765.1 shikimate dehydrogenase [Microbacterium sp. ASV81]
MTNDAFRLAVWGDPIDHSRSPQLHGAAYAALGLDWEYGRRRVDADGFDDAVNSLDGTWRGLSLTMPLKERARAWADTVDDDAALTGAVNTLLLGESSRGYNTDVGGLVQALRENGLGEISTARILGAGATARSALVTLARLGAGSTEIVARTPAKASALIDLAEQLGIRCVAVPFGTAVAPVDVTVSTLPSGTVPDPHVVSALASNGGALFDAAYAPWPSALAAGWSDATIVSGIEMLLQQAVLQVRIFVQGDPAAPLPDEAAVVGVMRAALMGD